MWKRADSTSSSFDHATDGTSAGKRARTDSLHGVVQRRVSTGDAGGASADTPRGGGAVLPGALAGSMGRSFEADFSSVRVHEGDHVSAMGAQAYALGDELHFAPGQFAPDSHAGRSLIGHELAHVVQQRSGRVAPTAQAKGAALNDDPALEAEADVAGERAARGEPAGLAAFGAWSTAVTQRKLVVKGADSKSEPEDLPASASDKVFMRVLALRKDADIKILDAIFTKSDKKYLVETVKDESVDSMAAKVLVVYDTLTASAAGGDAKVKTGPVKLYHGTTLTFAKAIAGGLKVEPRGKGELGLGFYLTHDLWEAAHIADYYCVQEAKDDTHWGVVEFQVAPEGLATLAHEHLDITAARREGEAREEPPESAWTTAPIVDKATPYYQHLMYGAGIDLLNDSKQTTRKMVKQGEVAAPVKPYDPHLPKKRDDRFRVPDPRVMELGAAESDGDDVVEDAVEDGHDDEVDDGHDDEVDDAPVAAAGAGIKAPPAKTDEKSKVSPAAAKLAELTTRIAGLAALTTHQRKQAVRTLKIDITAAAKLFKKSDRPTAAKIEALGRDLK